MGEREGMRDEEKRGEPIRGFAAFDNLMRKLSAVPKGEVDAAEREYKRRRKRLAKKKPKK